MPVHETPTASDAEMESLKKELSTKLGDAVLILAQIVIGIILQGTVLSLIWDWYMEPFGLPPITLAWACGLVLFVRLLTKPIPDAKELAKSGAEKKAPWYQNFIAKIVIYALVLLYAWVLHFFI